MGNENTKYSQQEGNNKEALRKQQEMFERRLLEMQKEQDRKKLNEAIEKAVKEAIQKEREKQVPQMQQSHDLGHFTNIQERRQNTSAIYPNLENFNDATVRQNTVPSPMHGPKTVTIEHGFSTTVPSAPPPDFSLNIAVASTSRRDNENNNNQFDCKSCNSKLGNQVFQCKNKHNSCFYCRTKQVRCGICQQNITDFRNYALEKRIDRTLNQHQKQLCPNSIDGCRLNFKAWDMPSHLKECLFSEIVCPLMYNKLVNCSWRGKINQLRVHFDEDHPEHCHGDVDKEMTLLNYKDNSHSVYFVTIGTFKFLIHIKVDAPENVIMMTAQIFGPQFTAEKWSYQFHVFNKRTPRRKYQYNGVCNSYAIDVNNIFAEANCAIMNSTYANSFADNGQLTYKFYLMKGFDKAGEKNVQASSS